MKQRNPKENYVFNKYQISSSNKSNNQSNSNVSSTYGIFDQALKLKTQHHNHFKQILNCFNNITAITQETFQIKDNQLLNCKRIFNREDQESQLPKFSSIQQSLSSSIDRTLEKDKILFDQICRSQNRQQVFPDQQDQQYSFNGDKTLQQIYKNKKKRIQESNTKQHTKFNAKSNTKQQTKLNIKNKYQNLMQKIDHFLVRDFAVQEQKIRPEKQKKQSVYKSEKKAVKIQGQCFQFKRQNNISIGKVQINEQSRNKAINQLYNQNIQVLAMYIRQLQDKNTQLLGQRQLFLLNQIKLKQFQKLIREKDKIILQLSQKLQSNQIRKNLQSTPTKFQQKQNIFPSQYQFINQIKLIKKQRNTISQAHIKYTNDQINKKRSSHYVQTLNNNIRKNMANQMVDAKQRQQNMSVILNESKNKSNAFLKRIFRKSSQNQINLLSKSQSANHKREIQEIDTIQILKQQNQILSTKINILYGDFHQIIDKYNQVLTQKQICKNKCCFNKQIVDKKCINKQSEIKNDLSIDFVLNNQKLNNNYFQLDFCQENKQYTHKQLQYKNNTEHPNHNNKLHYQSYFQSQLKNIMKNINNYVPVQKQNLQQEYQFLQRYQDKKLFTEQQISQIIQKSNNKYVFNINKQGSKNKLNLALENTMINKAKKRMSLQQIFNCNQIKNDSQKQNKNKQNMACFCNSSKMQLESSQSIIFRKDKRNKILQNLDYKDQRRYKIAPRQSIREFKMFPSIACCSINQN